MYCKYRAFPGTAGVKNSPANAGDAKNSGSIPGSGRSPGVGNGNLLQESCLENPMDRGAWGAAIHGVTKSRTRLSTRTHTQHTHAHTHTHLKFHNSTGVASV